MSRYPQVRRKIDVKVGPEDERARSAEIAAEYAEKLYLERGGGRIDAAITRAENMLKVHDQEVAKLLEGDTGSYRWKVSPTVVLRLERELERWSAEREKLLDECYADAGRVANETQLEKQIRNATAQTDPKVRDTEVVSTAVEPTPAANEPIETERGSAEKSDTRAA